VTKEMEKSIEEEEDDDDDHVKMMSMLFDDNCDCYDVNRDVDVKKMMLLW